MFIQVFITPFKNCSCRNAITAANNSMFIFIPCLVIFSAPMTPTFGYKSYTEISFRNPIESNRNQIVVTILRLLWNQTDVCLDPNQSGSGK